MGINVTPVATVAATIHDRMPVILPPESYEGWLSGAAGTEVLKPFPANLMKAYPVSTHVGSPKNDDAALVKEQQEAHGGEDFVLRKLSRVE